MSKTPLDRRLITAIVLCERLLEALRPLESEVPDNPGFVEVQLDRLAPTAQFMLDIMKGRQP